MDKRFNLIDEPWIPVADKGRVSLRQIFGADCRALGGNPVEKIALMKLLLAIAQAAATPEDETAWRELGAQGLADKCLEYLDKWHDRFDLYGDKPFLQMPAIAAAEIKSYGTVLPDVATGNTTVLTGSQRESVLTNAERAVLVVCQMGFALGGKKTDNKVVLTLGYQGKTNDKGKPSTGKPGPAVAHMGLLHSLLQGVNVQQSLWLNLLTREQVMQSQRFPAGIGVAPWQQMPTGEDDAVARHLKNSLIGRLLPLCRFCLLTEDGLHYSEGIAHPNYKEGMWDPTVAVNQSGKENKALWVNPEKRPWRELTALLGFLAQRQNAGFECLQLAAGVGRACASVESFAIWSGGLRVSSNAGEQYASGTDDFVASAILVHGEALSQLWFDQLQAEMTELDELAKGLYGRVLAYFKAQLVEGIDLAAQATHLFWQLCERDFQRLLDHCEQGESHGTARRQLRRRFAGYAQQAYDRYCPKDTARQLDAWARCRPNHGKYLQQEA
ncbi:type I-E CRISPR-associated protein Cse1/CasA [Rhodanobacter sp. Root561]|uniref:type I-E CRISPR-associated protein Cse1/CasA n=1 Tax=Rhodanobacter sp. Root561 TaxID=1736560 RepID=UPI0006FA65A0|nr:type I-E CRISPR-associated protein Cse1/CasA [Rhodanobacter sp. Root561]KQZ79505.1 type I-E CRISPR-associated protein Cse1/CasA [Rhodanobacter sp. Root561]